MIEVKLPDGSVAEFPDGTSPEVIKQALQKRFGGPQDNRPWYAKAGQAADDVVRLIANGATFGYADKLAGYMGGGGTESERALTQAARDRAGSAALPAELLGAVGTGFGAAKSGLTLMGRGAPAVMKGARGLAARSGVAAVEGAGYGALTAMGNDQDIGQGVALGALGGGLGNVAGEGIAAGIGKLGRAVGLVRADAPTRAAASVYEAASGQGRTDVMRRLNELGPEAMALDALGARGRSMARGAANLNPDAREALEASLLARKAGQNQRVVADLETAAGLPVGSRQSLDAFKKAEYAKVAPAINRAYEEARAKGFDIDTSQFSDILEAPSAQKAWSRSVSAVRDRVFPAQPQAQSVPLPPRDFMKKGRVARLLSENSPSAGNKPRALSLVEFLASRGGVQDFKGEVTRGLGLRKTTKFAGKRLVNEKGVPLDYAREAAAQAGYFNHIYGNADEATAKSTVADLLSLMDDDLRGSGVYAGDAVEQMAEWEAIDTARNSLRHSLEQIGMEINAPISDDVVMRAVGYMDGPNGVDPAYALEKAIYDDIAENGIAPMEVPAGMFNGEKVRQFSNLERLDETKKILDDMASSAFRAGRNAEGMRISGLAKALRERTDEVLKDPVYRNARGLREAAYRRSEAVDLGADMARGRVPLDGPSRAAAMTSNRDALKKGFAIQQSENLLNRGANVSALNSLQTPMGKEVTKAIYGGDANRIAAALAREQVFNQAVRDVTQNSTTARQLLDAAGTGAGTGAIAMAAGADVMTGGLAGLLGAAVRKGAPALQRAMSTKAQRDAAPYIAEMLLRRGLPIVPPIPPNALQVLAKTKGGALARALTLSGAGLLSVER